MENDDAPRLVLTTWPADAAVDAFAQALLDARLAACVHVLEAGASVYRWAGAIEHARERQVVIKTTRGRLAALEAHVAGLHPYDVPEWIVIEATASAAYGAWLGDSVRRGAGAAGDGG